MFHNRDPRYWLSPLLMLALDTTLTLCGQSSRYWSGAFRMAEEANPIAAVMLRTSPWLFLLVIGMWAIVLANIFRVWRSIYAWWLAVLLTISHAFGAAAWCIREGGVLGVAGAGFVFLIARTLLPAYPSVRSSTSS